jgi:hypothetical protein
MIYLLQILAVIFSLGMIYFALLHFRRGEITPAEMGSWTLIWSILIVIIFFPDVIRRFARTFLFARLFDLLVVGGIALCIFMVTRAYLTSRRLEKKLEDYVRKEALKDVKRKR